MKLEKYKLELQFIDSGDDSLEQYYCNGHAYECRLQDLVVGEEVLWTPEFRRSAWWTPEFTCKEVNQERVVLTIRSTTTVNNSRLEEEDVVFAQAGDVWKVSVYCGKTDEDYYVILKQIDE